MKVLTVDYALAIRYAEIFDEDSERVSVLLQVEESWCPSFGGKIAAVDMLEKRLCGCPYFLDVWRPIWSCKGRCLDAAGWSLILRRRAT